MAELNTLARPYARAAYEYAVQAGNLEQWSKALETLAGVVAQADIVSLLDSPSLSVQQQADALIDVCADQLADPVANLVRLLAENRRLALIPLVREQFEAHKAQQEKSINVEVISAEPLSDEQREKLSQALGRKVERSVNIETSVDPSLLGGVMIRAGDTIIDGSVRGRLSRLAEALNS